jgi:hypothetical protein
VITEKKSLKVSPLWVFWIFAIVKACKDIQNPYFWYDESGQFWISQGLNHESRPNSLRNSLPAIMESNSLYTFDPGGFSLILRLWSEVSMSAVWLRILPQVFFFLTLVAFSLLLRQMKVDHFTSSLALLLITLGIPGGDAAFLRPYSASLCSYVWILYIAIKILKQSARTKNLFPIILGVSTFGIWMRYDAMIWVFGIMISLFFSRKTLTAISFRDWKMLFSLFLFLSSGILISYLSLQNQVKNSLQMSYHTYIGSEPGFLMTKANLLFIVFFGLLYLIRTTFRCVKNDKELTFLFNQYGVLNVIYLLSSIFGLYPWHPWSHVSAPLPSGLILLTVITLHRIFQKSGALRVRLVMSVTAMMYFGVITQLGLTGSNGQEGGMKLISYFEGGENRCKGGEFLVDRWNSPTIRFFFEIQRPGLVKAFGYPDNFSFLPESSFTWDKSQLNTGVLSRYCALIVSEKSGDLDLQEWNQVIPNLVWTKL